MKMTPTCPLGSRRRSRLTRCHGLGVSVPSCRVAHCLSSPVLHLGQLLGFALFLALVCCPVHIRSFSIISDFSSSVQVGLSSPCFWGVHYFLVWCWSAVRPWSCRCLSESLRPATMSTSLSVSNLCGRSVTVNNQQSFLRVRPPDRCMVFP